MDVVEKIKSELSSSPVVLFMKGTPDFPQCGFSAQTVAALRAGKTIHSGPTSRSRRRVSSWAMSCHCSAALSDIQRPISAAVRKHPAQNPCASSVQTLVQGEGGRSGLIRSGIVLSKAGDRSPLGISPSNNGILSSPRTKTTWAHNVCQQLGREPP